MIRLGLGIAGRSLLRTFTGYDVDELAREVRASLHESARAAISGGIVVGLALVLFPEEVPGAVLEALKEIASAGREARS